jgi:hypothetical protein
VTVCFCARSLLAQSNRAGARLEISISSALSWIIGPAIQKLTKEHPEQNLANGCASKSFTEQKLMKMGF